MTEPQLSHYQASLANLQKNCLKHEKILRSILTEKKTNSVFPYFDMDTADTIIKSIETISVLLEGYCLLFQTETTVFSNQQYNALLETASELQVKYKQLYSQFYMYFIGQSSNTTDYQSCIVSRLENIHDWLTEREKIITSGFVKQNIYFSAVNPKLYFSLPNTLVPLRKVLIHLESESEYFQKIILWLEKLKDKSPYSLPEHQLKLEECRTLACAIEMTINKNIDAINSFIKNGTTEDRYN